MIFNASLIVWLAGACTVLGLAIYRKLVARQEDDMLHIRDSERRQVVVQTIVARQLDVVDKWGVKLTIGVAAFGAVLAGVYVYQVWMESLKIG